MINYSKLNRAVRIMFICIAVIVAFLAVNRLSTPESRPPYIELVLPEQTRLTVDTDAGSITLISDKGLERRYAWGNCELKTRLIPRSTRWYGSLGGYNPASGLDPHILFSFACDGISRPVVGEGQIHFETMDAAEYWISRYNSSRSPSVWSSDGVLLKWSLTPQRDQLNIDLWQICIAGRKPSALKGSRSGSFTHVTMDGKPASTLSCETVDKETMAQTEKTWREHWQQADDWRRAYESREQSMQTSRQPE